MRTPASACHEHISPNLRASEPIYSRQAARARNGGRKRNRKTRSVTPKENCVVSGEEEMEFSNCVLNVTDILYVAQSS